MKRITMLIVSLMMVLGMTAFIDTASATTEGATAKPRPVNSVVQQVGRRQETRNMQHEINIYYTYNWRNGDPSAKRWFKPVTFTYKYNKWGGDYPCGTGAFLRVRYELRIWSNATGANKRQVVTLPCQNDTTNGDVTGLIHFPRYYYKSKIPPKFAVRIVEEYRYGKRDVEANVSGQLLPVYGH